MLRVRNLALNAGAEPFDHDFIDQGITTVIGRNASGKTLLARIIAGLERPAQGQLYLDDVDLGALKPGARPVALVTQAFVNYPNWSVRDNLASPMRAAGVAAHAMQARVLELAEQLGLNDLLERLPAELSGGQQQRLAIGRALAKQAKVLVMDEPLVNLDYKLREALMGELRKLLRDQALTVIYTTSDCRDGFAMGDEVVLLADHSLVQTGTPLAVYRNPVSAQSAELMSDPGVNCWRVNGGLAVVRPEHLYLEAAEATDLAFPARLLSRETNGSETFLHCEVADEHWVVRLDGLIPAPQTEELTLYAAADSIYEFGEAAVG